jgi:hypothetical protein
MGVNAIVIVENRREISLNEFAAGLLADPWGKRAWNSLHLAEREDLPQSWIEFDWESKRYFSWIYSPRYRYLGLIDLDDDDVDPGVVKIVHITFLKVMHAVEKIAGGPVYVGNDVISTRTPSEVLEDEYPFFLPSQLDFIVPDWRKTAEIEIDEPYLVF